MDILEFSGPYRFLSNFYPAGVFLYSGGYPPLLMPTVEHAYQAAKTDLQPLREMFQNLKTPGQAKRVGQGLELRPDWDEVKLEVMRGLLQQKFHYVELRRQLIETHPFHLQEGNWWGDTFWGVCKGKGHNHLGRLLMEIREQAISQLHTRL